MFKILITSLLIFIQLQAFSKIYYNAKDLDILAKEANFEEYLKHAHDIRPSDRGKKWNEATIAMAIGLIDFNISRKIINSKAHKYIEKIATWPILRDDEIFNLKRNEYALKYFNQCAQSSCLVEIEKFWEKSKKSSELALKLLTRAKELVPNYQGTEFLVTIISSKFSDLYCKKPYVRKLLTKKVFDETKTKEKFSEIKSIFDKNINSACWQGYEPYVKTLLKAESTTYSLLAYQLLKTKNAINEADEDLFLFTFILNGPVVGDTFNLAWSNLKKIKNDYKRRARLLRRIENLYILPDRLFNSPNVKRRNILIQLIADSFPEYVDYYSGTCLNYYEGAKEFPLGNPTQYCKQFFKVAGNKVISQPIKLRYSAIKK